MTWVILGCGYSGETLARELLRRGEEVVAARRSGEDLGSLEALGAQVRACDITRPETLTGWIPAASVIVDSVPPGESTQGEENVVAAAAAASARRIVYLSSTGVYPEGDGGWTDEDAAPAPIGTMGERRWAAEKALFRAAERAEVEAVSLRIAGIYGPGRGVIARMRAGTYRIIGPGTTYVSRIHVDDLVQAILAAGTAAALRRRVYNLADDEPTTARAYAGRVAEELGLAPPPLVPLSEAPASAAALFTGNRRISNRRLKEELGVRLRYPTWREALAAARGGGAASTEDPTR